MKQIALSEYAETYGQLNTANALGVRQSAISKAIARDRDIVVIVDGEGRIRAEERKPFPSQKREPKDTN